jgi:hypothetical protein
MFYQAAEKVFSGLLSSFPCRRESRIFDPLKAGLDTRLRGYDSNTGIMQHFQHLLEPSSEEGEKVFSRLFMERTFAPLLKGYGL